MNEKYPDFVNYGGAGIKVCQYIKEDWTHLVALIGKKPEGRYLVDRIEGKFVNGGGMYSCGSCEECTTKGWVMNIRWADDSQSARNRKSNHPVTINGITRLIVEWAEISGIAKGTILKRIKMGWPPERLLDPTR